MKHIWIVGLGFVCLATHANPQLQYPGQSPGAPVVNTSAEGILLSNQVLLAQWRLGASGLKLARVADFQSSQTLTLAGELFSIRLADGQNYDASRFIASSRPRQKALRSGPSGAQVEIPLQSRDGRIRVLWRATLREQANYIRQEIDIRAAGQDCVLREVGWLDETLAGVSTQGQVDGSPVAVGSFFLGCEDPHARNRVDLARSSTGPHVSCVVRPELRLQRGEKFSLSFVIGVVPEGQLRRGFLYYLEKERAHPYRPFLHYNSWYDIAWEPFALNETNCLEAINAMGQQLVQGRGAVLDAMVFDDGWDNPHTLWQFHRGFPHGFTPLTLACQKYHTHLGVWLSPFGGYGESRRQRLQFGSAQGYETNAVGFSLAGPKYYAAFKRACVDMIRKYRVNHFKFDGIAQGTYAQGGAEYYRDTEAMERLMLQLRREEPDLYINLTTGSWPSPFWLRYADSLWRQGGDMGFCGKGARQQQWLTYRDREVYRNVVCKAPLFPLNALMTQGVAYSRQGTAGDPTFDSAGFKDDVRAFFGSGTSLQELYIQPARLRANDWAVLAEAAKWSRANSDVLVDTHWLGGDPGQGEVYGYAAWNLGRGVIMLRNPDDQPHQVQLRLAQILELPMGAATRYTLKSPWPEDVTQPAIPARAESPLTISLPPFAVKIYEVAPGSPGS